LGQPNQFGGENETADEQPKNEQSEKTQNSRKSSRKLYRDPDNKVLGGVLAGLAAYFNFDVTWLRVLVIALLIFGVGAPIPLYVIAWFVMPKAETAAQKLEMRGKEVTVDNIKKFFESEQFRENAGQIGSKFGEFFILIAKVFLVFVGAIAIIVGFSIILAIIIAAAALLFSGKWAVFDSGTVFHAIFWSSIALLVLIPAVGIFVSGMRLIKSRGNMQKPQQRTGIFGWLILVLWIISLLALIAFAVQKENFMNFEKWDEIGNKIYGKSDDMITESRYISAFNAIKISNGIDACFVNSDSVFVDISAEESSMKDIICEVKDSVLYLKSKIGHKIFSRKGVHAKIGINKIKSIAAQNGCDISKSDTVFTENLAMNFANGCNIDVCVKADNLNLNCSSGCNARLSVDTDKLQIVANNGCNVNVRGVANHLSTSKNNGSNINVKNLSDSGMR